MYRKYAVFCSENKDTVIPLIPIGWCLPVTSWTWIKGTLSSCSEMYLQMSTCNLSIYTIITRIFKSNVKGKGSIRHASLNTYCNQAHKEHDSKLCSLGDNATDLCPTTMYLTRTKNLVGITQWLTCNRYVTHKWKLVIADFSITIVIGWWCQVPHISDRRVTPGVTNLNLGVKLVKADFNITIVIGWCCQLPHISDRSVAPVVTNLN